jgi:hypothetical protein
MRKNGVCIDRVVRIAEGLALKGCGEVSLKITEFLAAMQMNLK